MNTTLKRTLIVGALLSTASLAPKAQAQVLTVYNFNDANTLGTSTTANIANLFSVDRGTGTLTTNVPAANIVSFTGTIVNADSSDPAGAALALQGGTGAAAGGVGGNNGDYLQLATSTAGFSNIVVSFAAQATATGFTSDVFQYSTDGATFTTFASFAPPTSFGAATGKQTFDLSSITGLNDNANAAFRLVLNGATSSGGNIRIDNLLVTAAPEPSGTASILVGAALMGGLLCMARRRTAGQSQAA